MTASKGWGLALALASAVTLGGCTMGDGGAARDTAGAEGKAAPATKSARIVERDVEAPQVFSSNDTALWDGRPSLGGVWVAHPDVKDPERVIIRNPANGKFVIGALFRRERDNPGPKLQVSSDAAAALDMLAGAPTKLSVVALRREEHPDPATATATAEKPGAAAQGAEDITATPLAAPPPGKPPKGAKPAAKDSKTAKPGAAAGAASAGTASAGAASGGAETTSAAKPAPNAPKAAAAPKAEAKPAAKSAKTYVQIGIFSQQANAERAVAQLKKAGIASTIHTGSAKDKTFWRVVAGPSGTDSAALLSKIKGIGFPDAYAVSK